LTADSMHTVLMTGNVITLNLDWHTVLIWAIVGLVAGFLASHVMLGHGMGLFGDILIGVIGGIGANLFANFFNFHFAIAGHPIISDIVTAFRRRHPADGSAALRSLTSRLEPPSSPPGEFLVEVYGPLFAAVGQLTLPSPVRPQRLHQ